MAVNKHIKLFATVASIVYFLLYVAMVLILAIITYKTGDYDDKSKTTFLKAVWKKRSIYGQILVHIYDTATDFGVLIGWGILAYDDTDYESIDMLALFWTSIGFLIAYRVLTMCMGVFTAVDSTHRNEVDNNNNKITDVMINCCLAIFDIYIFRIVYEALTQKAKEPSGAQKFVQLVESIFESLPQVVLQSVFIIRAQNDTLLKENSSIILVGLSLGASLFSISNKFTWVDYDSVKEEAQEAEFKRSYPCINKWYVLRIVWRYSFVAVHFAVFSLIWSVMGGAFVGIFIAFSFLYWGLYGLYLWIKKENPSGCGDWFFAFVIIFMYGSICLISTPANDKTVVAVMHAAEMIVSLSVITWFATDPNIDCGICADPDNRQASSNKYILMFIIGGWCAMVIDFIAYFLMLYFQRISEVDMADNFAIFGEFTDNKMEKE
eukprot:7206_1